jgi:hypothetical protein
VTRYRRAMKTTLAAAAAACLLLSGCGSDDSAKDGGDRGVTITKAQFIIQGDAICTSGNDRIAAAEKKLPGEPTKDQIVAFVTGTFIPQIAAEAKALRSLPAPDEGADDVEAMLDSLDAAVKALEKDPEQLLTGDGVFDEANQLAKDYGFKVCGEE